MSHPTKRKLQLYMSRNNIVQKEQNNVETKGKY
jgi:hypothetical protein